MVIAETTYHGGGKQLPYSWRRGVPVARLLALVLLAVMSLPPAAVAQAEAPVAASAPDARKPEELRRTLRSALGGVEILAISPSALDGFYSVQLAEGNNVLVRSDGEYFIAGDLYGISAGGKGVVNYSEQQRSGWRKTQMERVSKRDLLIFSPKTGKKTHINIFTDVDCGYCRRLHQEMSQINRYGIEVRYLAFPRAGVGSPTYNKMVTAWCAANAKRTLTDLKSGIEVPTKLCIDNPVSKQYELGKQLGVRGTPAIFTASGELLPGYLPAEVLAKRVGVR